MKILKIISIYLFVAAFMMSCEQEMAPSQEEDFNTNADVVPGTSILIEKQTNVAVNESSSKRALSPADFSKTSNNLNTDFLSFGIGGLRDVGSGSIEVTGISNTIKEAYIYWHGVKNSVTDIRSLNVNETVVIGENLGYSGSNRHPEPLSQSLKADITDLVKATGNGTYNLKDFGDLNPNGATIIIFFDDGDASNNRDITIIEGNDSSNYF